MDYINKQECMSDFYKVKVEFFVNTKCQEQLLVSAITGTNIDSKVKLYFKSAFGINPLSILSVKKSEIVCFLGNPDADFLYICKLEFICTNMEKPKRRVIAVGANTINKALEAIDKAFEDITTIKKLILSERQLKILEYNDEIEYIDYVVEGIVRCDMSYVE